MSDTSAVAEVSPTPGHSGYSLWQLVRYMLVAALLGLVQHPLMSRT